jgi:glycosyltransferase involved in cell wall biosynthesis
MKAHPVLEAAAGDAAPMRLAFLTSLVPTDRPDTGFEIANASLLDALDEAGCEVTIFGFRRPSDRPDPRRAIVSLGEIDIETAKASSGTRLGWLAGSALSGLPLSAAKLRRLSGRSLLKRMERSGPFDGVIVNTAQMAAAFPRAMRRWPAILVAHNVEHVSARENAETAGNRALRFAYAREARLLERAERSAIAAARHVFFLSAEDRAALPGARSQSVLALLTPDPPAGASSPPAFDVGLIGTWTWRPNRVGLDWFLDEVALRLPTDVSIGVAGRFAGPEPKRLNAHMLGLVPDAAEFVRSCRVIALASRIGTGVQLKTIEMMRLGRPAIATSSSLRGVAYRPENVVVEDDPAAFATALAAMVARSRAGEDLAVDGGAFAAAQRAAMRQAVAAGMAAMRA